MLGAKKAPLTFRQIVRALGPGLVTGAADDDPSGIATYSQAGAQFGFNLLWTVFLTTPFMLLRWPAPIARSIGCITRAKVPPDWPIVALAASF